MKSIVNFCGFYQEKTEGTRKQQVYEEANKNTTCSTHRLKKKPHGSLPFSLLEHFNTELILDNFPNDIK